MRLLQASPPTACFACDEPLEGLQLACTGCQPLLTAGAASGSARAVRSNHVLSAADFDAQLQVMKRTLPKKRRDEYESTIRRAAAWGRPRGLKFPWSSRDAMHYAQHLLVEHGALHPLGECDLAESVPPERLWTGNKMHYVTFAGQMAAIDWWHATNEAGKPWTQARDLDFNESWKVVRKLGLNRARSAQKDALLLPDLLRILRALDDPDPRTARDAALLGVLCNPTLKLRPHGVRPTPMFLTDVTMGDVEIQPDPHGLSVVIRGSHNGRPATLNVPPGATADALSLLVLIVQGQLGALSGRGLRGRIRDESVNQGTPLFRKRPWGPEAPGLTYTGLRAAALEVVATHLGVEKVSTFPELDPKHLDDCVRAELRRVSLRVALDAAWLSNAWWLAARGMEVLSLRRRQVTVADTHVKFKLLRKESRDNGEVPFQSPHIEIPWADPVHLLRRALWMTHRELCARGDEEALNGFMMGAQWLLPSDLRTMSATDTVGEHNTRLQGYVDMLRLKGPSGSPLDVGTHSLRSGLINSAFMLGMDIQKIMLHTDHRDVDSLLQYARRVQLEHKDYSLPNDMLFTLRIGGSDPAKPPIVQEVQQLLRPSVEAGELCSLPGCVAQRRNGRGIMALIDAA